MGVPLNEVFSALQVYLGGYYVNDFNRFGRTWQVNIQAEAPFRISRETVKLFKVRNNKGEMVPLGAVLTIRDDAGPVVVNRYNMYPAAALNGVSLPGVSTGTIIRQMEELSARELPPAMATEWTELTYLQKQSSKAETARD